MSELQFKYHPILKGLKIAEDGSQVLLNGEKLHIHIIKKTGFARIALDGRTKIGVAKLVLEAFVELRPSLNHRCVKIDKDKGIHHTNLQWQEKHMTTQNASRKLTDAQEEEITRRHDAGGITRKELADEFGLNLNTISAIKKRVYKRRKK